MNYTLEKFEKTVSLEEYIEEYVDVEQFLEFCKACPSYGNIWSCPPYDFDPMDIWNSYDSILIKGYQINYSGERTAKEMEDVMYKVKGKVSEELFVLEEKIEGSLSLSAGSCHICKGCSKPDGKPCRYPEKMRYSIESLGGDVGKTLSRLCGIELEWIEEGKLPDHFVLCGALLMK